MSKVASNWMHGIGQNIASTLLLTVLGGLAVMLGSLTPAIEQYAPFSYLITFFVGVALALVVANLAIVAWRRLILPTSAASPSPSGVAPPYDDTKLLAEVGELGSNVELLRQDCEGLARNQEALNQQIFQAQQGAEAEFEKMRNELRLANLAARFVIREHQARVANEVRDQLGKLEKTFSDWEGGETPYEVVRDRGRICDGIRGALFALGAGDLGQAIKARQDEIKTKNEYVLLSEDDKKRWSAPEEKRKWYLDRAEFKVLSDAAGKYPRTSPDIQSAVSLVSAARELADGQ